MPECRPSSPEVGGEAVVLAVDLSNLRPGGENGGVKPFVFETILWLGRQTETPLRFLYLTCSSTHAEVRERLARIEDEVVCVRGGGEPGPRPDGAAPREHLALPAPADLLCQHGAQVLYCPFGEPEFATPGIATICTVVDVLHRDFPWSLAPRHNELREATFQRMVRVADRLQCISHHVAGRMREVYGVEPERLFTTHIAVHQRFAVLPDAGRAAREAGAAPFFFYPANSWKHKNHEALLLAYGIYRADALAAGTIPWPLVCTGHDDERWRELRALATTLDLAGAPGVTFRDYVPSDEFGRLWETAGALVFPSLHEGFGIPLVEAMHHDLPILASGEGSLSEVAGDACLYADARQPAALAAGLTRMATDAGLRARLVEAGRRRLQDFSLARESTHLLAAILELAQARPAYHPSTRGIHPDGWTERFAVLALPAVHDSNGVRGRLTFRFHPIPAARRLRVRAGRATAFGSFPIPAAQSDHAFTIDFRPSQSVLWLEIPDAANLDATDGRLHGVRLREASLRIDDGPEVRLFAAA